uniref:Uncharacterized protein n=1 Tax=Proboscia inermis TaxID=420281 RepID=A0A7S0C378_9STRA
MFVGYASDRFCYYGSMATLNTQFLPAENWFFVSPVPRENKVWASKHSCNHFAKIHTDPFYQTKMQVLSFSLARSVRVATPNYNFDSSLAFIQENQHIAFLLLSSQLQPHTRKTRRYYVEAIIK